MAGNTLLTIDMLTKESLMLTHERAAFVGTIDRSYDSSFAKTGAKIGDTLRIRKPNQYTVTTASRIAAPQAQAEANTTLTVANQYHVDMEFNSAELALTIDEFSDRYLKPATSVLMSQIDGECLVAATKATWNVAGTAGTVPGTVTSGFSDTTALGQARAYINQGLAPEGDRTLQMDSFTMASVANGVKGLMHPQNQIEKAFRDGFLARTALADLVENERTWTYTSPDDRAGAIDESAATNFVQGATKVHIDALGSTALAVGTPFTWAGIYTCHPETKQSTGKLQSFVITKAVTPGSNEADVEFAPAIYTTGAKQNVCTSTGAEVTWTYTAQDGQVITFLGAADSTAYRQSLMYHKSAFAFVTADLPLYGGQDTCKRMTQDGISLRLWQAGDIINDRMLLRMDILWGFAALNPYFACRITN